MTCNNFDACPMLMYFYFKSKGEYIAPEKIEIVYLRSSFVSQVFVTGDSLKVRAIASSCPVIDRCSFGCSLLKTSFY